MAINNYGDLRDAIADFLDRDDTETINRIPTFVSLCEASINRDVRHYLMQNRATSTVRAGSQYVQAPADWIETKRLHLGSGGTLQRMEFVPDTELTDFRERYADTSGTPKYYAHIDGGFEFYPTPDADYSFELLYLQKVTPLSADGDTNWLLRDHPDVYLYGSLIHSAPFLAEDERAGVWAQLYGAALERVNTSSRTQQASSSGKRMKIRGLP